MSEPLLASLTPDERAEVEALLVDRSLSDGELLFSQADPADGAYIVRRGAISLAVTLPGGDELPLMQVGQGEIVGESALLVGGPRLLTARAVGATEVATLDRHDYQGLRHSYRPASFKILLSIARLIGHRLQRADAATIGARMTVASPAPPALGTCESPGCSFDPRPYLPGLSFFRDLPTRDREALLELGTLWELPRGRALLAAGQHSDRCFIVVRGAVEAVNPAVGRRVALFGPGRMLGQLAPLLRTPVIADCGMREAGVVLELGAPALAVLLEPASPLSYRFVNGLCLALLGGYARANRVLARAESQRRGG